MRCGGATSQCGVVGVVRNGVAGLGRLARLLYLAWAWMGAASTPELITSKACPRSQLEPHPVSAQIVFAVNPAQPCMDPRILFSRSAHISTASFHQLVRHFVTDAMGGNGPKDVEMGEVKAAVLDDEFLEVASCLVKARIGDVVLIFPDVFHRTQDVVVSRVAFIVEAF